MSLNQRLKKIERLNQGGGTAQLIVHADDTTEVFELCRAFYEASKKLRVPVNGETIFVTTPDDPGIHLTQESAKAIYDRLKPYVSEKTGGTGDAFREMPQKEAEKLYREIKPLIEGGEPSLLTDSSRGGISR